jgi:hypothetical protein
MLPQASAHNVPPYQGTIMPQDNRPRSNRLGTIRVLVFVSLSVIAALAGLLLIFTSNQKSRTELFTRFKAIIAKAKKSIFPDSTTQDQS